MDVNRAMMMKRAMMMRSETGERWIKYYSSAHSILLVGEGDFSFSLCLGMTFGCANNIIATSLDTDDELINKYKYAKHNLEILRILGASVFHGVDATQMMTLPELWCKKFHRIIYNFPHAGFYGKEDNPDVMKMHRGLVCGFLQNASSMLHFDGEIHVNHKTKAPFDSWKIEDLGSEFSLVCIAQDEFRIDNYPGYNNKRGSGPRADEPFPLGACKTYRFRLCPAAVNNLMMRKAHLMPQMFITPVRVQHHSPMPPSTSHQMFPTHPPVVQHLPPSRPFANYDSGAAFQDHASECRRIFGRYLSHVEETFGDTSYDVRGLVMDALQHGYEMYVSNAAPGRPLSDFIGILKVLHHWSILRSEQLRQMLFRHHLG